MSNISGKYQYYVEGECEKKLVKTLAEQRLIISGKTDVFNPVQNLLKSTHLRTLSPHTTIILIFDTDKPDTTILKQNLIFLESQSNIRKVITIPQYFNLEQELINCTDIRHAKDLLNCKHESEFKNAFIEEKHLFEKLQTHKFTFSKLWNHEPSQPFQLIKCQNNSHFIKLKKENF